MECLGLKITDGSRYRAVLLLVVYRPGSQAVTDEFFDELQLVLTSIQSTAHETVIVGDFNVHVDVPTDSVAQQLNDVLADHGLRQHVDVATHDRGHTLDLVVTADSYELKELTVIDPCVSDHYCISFNAPFTRPPAHAVTFTTRSWVKFDINRFESDLAVSDLGTTDSTDVHQLFEMYDTTLRTLLDKHAPQRTVVRRRRPLSPWYDADCQQAKKEVRRLESIYRRRSTPAVQQTVARRGCSLQPITPAETAAVLE